MPEVTVASVLELIPARNAGWFGMVNLLPTEMLLDIVTLPVSVDIPDTVKLSDVVTLPTTDKLLVGAIVSTEMVPYGIR